MKRVRSTYTRTKRDMSILSFPQNRRNKRGERFS
jgi:hypothetical protein